MRLVTLVCVSCLTACGGGKSEAESAEAKQLSAADKCIRDANIERQVPVDAPQRIDAVHILVKHAGVEGAIKQDIYRTREEACLRAQEAREYLLSENDWDAAFKKYSDGGGATEGALYDVTHGDMDEAFANAAFALGVDEVGHVVESKRGFHIILRRK
jgi:parvulin-like peptidyl-prolyl isomerase